MNTKQVLGLLGVAVLGTVGTIATFGVWGTSRERKNTVLRSSVYAGITGVIAGAVTQTAAAYIIGQTGIARMRALGLIDVQRRNIGMLDVSRRNIGMLDVSRRNIGMLDVSRRNIGMINVQRSIGR